MFVRIPVGGMIVVCLLVGGVPAQEAPPGAPEYRFVSVDDVESLQQELDVASAGGYAVAFGAPAYGVLVLRRRTATDQPLQYRVFQGKESIESGLANGHRPVPSLLDTKTGRLTLVASRATDADQYESLLVDANRTSTLEREVRQAVTDGYRVVGMASDDSGHSVLLERRVGTTPNPSDAALTAFVAVNRQETLEKELAGPAAAGYRVAHTSAWKEVLVFLERTAGEAPVGYRVLSTTRTGTLAREMSVAATEGYRYTPWTLHAVQKGSVLGLGRMGSEYVVIMEKSGRKETRPEYFLIGARRVGTLALEFEETVAKGFAPIAMTLGYSDQDTVIVFERGTTP